MQLRNGKQSVIKPTVVSNEIQSFKDTIKLILDHISSDPGRSSIERIQLSTPIFETINQQSVETLTGVGNNHMFLSTIYKKATELTCVIIERSYTNMYLDSDDEKIAIIRLLSEMFRAKRTISRILWKARTDPNIQDMMEKEDGHSELLYRCLRHIVSDDNEYDIHLYEDGEYTDVELYDWYFLENYGKDESCDSFIMNSDACFGADIRGFNSLLWK